MRTDYFDYLRPGKKPLSAIPLYKNKYSHTEEITVVKPELLLPKPA